MLDYRQVYSIGTKSTPRHLNISLIPDYKTRGDILAYLRKVGLTGWPMQSSSLNSLHCTVLDNANQLLPPDFPKEQPLNSPIDLSGLRHHVRPLGTANRDNLLGTPIAILFPGAKRIRNLSDLLHKKFKLQPETEHYIFHITISKIQLFPPKSKAYEKCKFKDIRDYFRLPYYDGRMVFDQLVVNYDNR